MKVLLLASLFVSSSVFASEVPAICFAHAEKAVSKVAKKLTGVGYDKNEFDAYECSLAANKAAVICGVSASKGDGETQLLF